MSKKYAKLNEIGLPVAFYDDGVNKIPEGAIDISEADWMECLENQGRRKFVKGVLKEYTPPPPTASEQALIDIRALEASITPRRIREAVLGTDNGWMADVEEQIEALRGNL